MKATLPLVMGRSVNGKVKTMKTDTYQSASEGVSEGSRLLKKKDLRIEALRSDVQAGFIAVDQG